MSGREKFKKYNFFIKFTTSIFSKLPYQMNLYLFKKSRNLKGVKGLFIRYIFLKILANECGENVYLDYGVEIKNIDKLKIGNNVSIHQTTYIDAVGGISIGDDVSIAHSCSLLSFNHSWKDKNIPIKYNEISLEPILISSDVWVGCGVRILAGATLSSRTVVGANAVVIAKKYPENTIVGGIPATVIKTIE